MIVAVGCDHGGFDLKEAVLEVLRAEGHEVRDFGTMSRESVDYPDFALAVARAVAAGEAGLGVLMCGTGIGVSITANKVPGIRAALCAEPYSARMARQHNDANVLCLGARVVGPGLAQDIVRAFLNGQFEGGRHARRVEKIRGIERETGLLAPPQQAGG